MLTQWDDKFEQEHWTPQEIAEAKAQVAKIGAIFNAERNGEISHDEAMIRHLMLDPDLAENMLDDAYGNAEETRNVKRRINEAKRRTQETNYWNNDLMNFKNTEIIISSVKEVLNERIDKMQAIIKKNVSNMKAEISDVRSDVKKYHPHK